LNERELRDAEGETTMVAPRVPALVSGKKMPKPKVIKVPYDEALAQT